MTNPFPLVFTNVSPKYSGFCADSVLLVTRQDPRRVAGVRYTSAATSFLVFVPDPEHQWDGASLP